MKKKMHINKKNILLAVGILSVVIISYFVYRNVLKTNYENGDDYALCPNCNVLLVAYDATQANHVSHLGYYRKTTPMLDEMASHGISFTNTKTVAPWTIPSYMAIFTGMYPTEHKLVNKWVKYTKDEKIMANIKDLSPNIKTLAQTMKENGYVTGGFTGDSGVSSNYGYDQGFDVYLDDNIFGSITGYENEALSWLNTNKDNKFFMFLHGYDSHGQFDVGDNYEPIFKNQNYQGKYKGTAEEQRDLRNEGLMKGELSLEPADAQFWQDWYDSKILDGDTRFANFWQKFKNIQFKNKTIVIMLSDHGSEFYEHKAFDHGHTLYNELIHVPLMFVIPGIEGGKQVNEQVRTIDIAPTIIELIGINPSEQFKSQQRGESLVTAINGGEIKNREVYLETDLMRHTYKRGVITADGWKYIMTMETGKDELYYNIGDPNDHNNLIDINLEKRNELKKKLLDHLNSLGTNPEGPWIRDCYPVYGDQCKI